LALAVTVYPNDWPTYGRAPAWRSNALQTRLGKQADARNLCVTEVLARRQRNLCARVGKRKGNTVRPSWGTQHDTTPPVEPATEMLKIQSTRQVMSSQEAQHYGFAMLQKTTIE
jgi:hypothetical protein